MKLTQITRTGQCTWDSKNILAVSFAPLAQQSVADGEKPDAVQLRKFLTKANSLCFFYDAQLVLKCDAANVSKCDSAFESDVTRRFRQLSPQLLRSAGGIIFPDAPRRRLSSLSLSLSLSTGLWRGTAGAAPRTVLGCRLSSAFLSPAPVTVRGLQDLSRISIRRTLRSLSKEEAQGKDVAQRLPQKRKRRRCRRRRINTYVFVGNQLIPQMVESEEEEHAEEEHKEAEEEEERDLGDIELLKQVNMLRDQIMSLPLPESLKAYLLYYREK